jgi:hypothetical protein
MFTVNPPEMKSNENEGKMHFTWSPAVLSTYKLPLKGLCEIIIVKFIIKTGLVCFWALQLINSTY